MDELSDEIGTITQEELVKIYIQVMQQLHKQNNWQMIQVTPEQLAYQIPRYKEIWEGAQAICDMMVVKNPFEFTGEGDSENFRREILN